MAKPCKYNGKTYSDGSTVCQNGETHRCDDGSWTNLHTKCTSANSDEPEDTKKSEASSTED
jgi:hypothetical protein